MKGVTSHIKRVIGGTHREYDEMYTPLVQIEGWVNSRPSIYTICSNEESGLKVNDLVLLKEDVTSLTKWNLGLVMETNPGKANEVHVVNVKTNTAVYERFVSKFIKFPIEN